MILAACLHGRGTIKDAGVDDLVACLISLKPKDQNLAVWQQSGDGETTMSSPISQLLAMLSVNCIPQPFTQLSSITSAPSLSQISRWFGWNFSGAQNESNITRLLIYYVC
jgi:hypothetical protein